MPSEDSSSEPLGVPKHPEGMTHKECPTCWGGAYEKCMCCHPELADQPLNLLPPGVEAEFMESLKQLQRGGKEPAKAPAKKCDCGYQQPHLESECAAEEEGALCAEHLFGQECPCPPSCGCCRVEGYVREPCDDVGGATPPQEPPPTPEEEEELAQLGVSTPGCDCGHPVDEHSVYGCADGCACEWMPKTAPADPLRDDLWCKIEKAVYEYRERTMLWEETGGITEGIADAARRAVQAPPAPPRRPPVAVAYGVEGGALFEVLVPGDATVAALEGRLVITHARQVAGIVQIKPYGEEGES